MHLSYAFLTKLLQTCVGIYKDEILEQLINTHIYKYYKDKRQGKEKSKQQQHHQHKQQQAGYELNIKLADVIHEGAQNESVYTYTTIL